MTHTDTFTHLQRVKVHGEADFATAVHFRGFAVYFRKR